MTTAAASSASSPSSPNNIITHNVINIDGSYGEGGGQLLRNTISYATILQKSVCINNIRSSRTKPGLRPQHMTGIRLCRDISIAGGSGGPGGPSGSSMLLVGDEIGSTTVQYCNPTILAGAAGTAKQGTGGSSTDAAASNRTILKKIVGDTKTAGSICLLLQAALPCALFSRTHVELELRGGTNASMAPQIDYMTEVFLPILTTKFGIPDDKITINIERRGYFPKGGGIVRVKVSPLTISGQKLQPVSMMDRGEVTSINIRAFYAGKCPKYVAQTIANAAYERIQQQLGLHHVNNNVKPTVEVVCEPNAIDSASGILIVARTATGCIFGGSALGSHKIRPRITGETAANELLLSLNNNSGGACVDGWLQDQLILYMALADGTSEIRSGCYTLHTRTAIHSAEQMTGAKFEVIRLTESETETDGGNRNDNATTERKGGSSSNFYGHNGLVEGQHIIRCHGIGYTTTTTT